ncbi:MAG TPA: OmpA family protein [Chryseosolibacter sp.]|nr:OmpA family protein [Chryseosolibacter sp.]
MNRLLLACMLVGSCLLISTLAEAQHLKEIPPGYYVVVSAFSPDREDLAINYVSHLKKDKNMEAAYGFHSERGYWYVYLPKHETFRTAVDHVKSTRKDPEFEKAWVRNVKPFSGIASVTKQELVRADSVQADEVVETAPEMQIVEDPTDTIVVTDNEEIIQYDVMTLGNTEVFLSLYNARNNRIVEGKVKVVDTDRNNLIKEVDGNDYLELPNPKNTSGKLTLICEAFGYRKVQQEINYPLPLADTAKSYVELMGTTFIVYFDLLRYLAGDIATLYNVYFYNDAAVMLPESKFELTSLLQMMQENPEYRIRLHGHSNGRHAGRIIKMGQDGDFFSLNGSVNGYGSAKDLSEARASIIKEYLVANGIAADRVEVKAWGGKKPLYDRNSANAKRNVRVEVEVLDDK